MRRESGILSTKTIGVICTVLGGALGLWVIARLSSVLGQQQTWAPPFQAYEAVTLAGAGVAVLLLIVGLIRLTEPNELSSEAREADADPHVHG